MNSLEHKAAGSEVRKAECDKPNGVERTGILTGGYTKLTVMKEGTGEVVAEITDDEVIPATGHIVKLTPRYV